MKPSLANPVSVFASSIKSGTRFVSKHNMYTSDVNSERVNIARTDIRRPTQMPKHERRDV